MSLECTNCGWNFEPSILAKGELFEQLTNTYYCFACSTPHVLHHEELPHPYFDDTYHSFYLQRVN